MPRGAGQDLGVGVEFSVVDVIRGDIPQLPPIGMCSNMPSRDSMLMFVHGVDVDCLCDAR